MKQLKPFHDMPRATRKEKTGLVARCAAASAFGALLVCASPSAALAQNPAGALAPNVTPLEASRSYLRELAAQHEALAAGDPRDLRLAIVYYEEWLRDEGPTPERAAVEARLHHLRQQRSSTPLAKASPMITHSLGLAAGGYVLTTLGVGSVVGGSIAAAQASDPRYSGFWMLVGVPLLIHGVICLATGIPMVVVGHRKIPPVLAPIVLQPLRTGEVRGPRAPVGLAITGTF